MTNYTDEIAKINLTPVFLVKIYLDQCPLENGQAPCEAVLPCYFSFTTCKDVTNYIDNWDGDTRCYRFVNRGAYLTNAAPLLLTPFDYLPVRIDQEQMKTERGQMTFNFAETAAFPLANPNKATSQNDAGYFWRNLLA